MTQVHCAVWLLNIGTVGPVRNSRNEVQIDIIILGKIFIFLIGIGNQTVPFVGGGGGDRHYLGSHIVDPFPRTANLTNHFRTNCC